MATEKESDWKTGFAFNSASGLVQFILTAVLMFLSIPIFINRLGEVAFGVFSTVAVVGNLTLFANLSLDSALVKFLAEQGKTKESNYDIVVSLIIVSSILIPLSFIAYLFREFIVVDILNIPKEYVSDALVLTECFLIANALLLIGRIVTSILDSLHKVYLTNFAMFIYNIAYWGGIIIIVSLGHTLKEIGLAILVAAAAWFVLIIVLALKEWGRVDLQGLRLNFKRIAKKQISYTSKIYAGSLLAILFEPLTKVLIANFAGGVVMVGAYEIGTRVKGQIMALFIKILYPIYPIIARLTDKERIGNIINRMTYTLCFLVLPIVILVTFGAESFLNLWIGRESINESVVLSVIVLTNTALLFSIVVTPVFYYIRAKNHAEKEIYIQGVNVIVNIAVILLLYSNLGFYSALLSNAMALFASFCLCLYYQYKYLNFNLLHSMSGSAKFVLYILSTICVALAIRSVFSNYGVLYLLVLSVGVVAVGFIVSYLLKILTKENINLIRNLSE